MTYPLAKEMFLYLSIYGEYRLVWFYKDRVSDSDISGVIGAWACSIKPIEVITQDYWNRYQKINKIRL